MLIIHLHIQLVQIAGENVAQNTILKLKSNKNVSNEKKTVLEKLSLEHFGYRPIDGGVASNVVVFCNVKPPSAISYTIAKVSFFEIDKFRYL